jgi:hypothetical protein
MLVFGRRFGRDQAGLRPDRQSPVASRSNHLRCLRWRRLAREAFLEYSFDKLSLELRFKGQRPKRWPFQCLLSSVLAESSDPRARATELTPRLTPRAHRLIRLPSRGTQPTLSTPGPLHLLPVVIELAAAAETTYIRAPSCGERKGGAAMAAAEQSRQ